MRKIILSCVFILYWSAVFSQYNVSGTGSLVDRSRSVQEQAEVNNFSVNKMQARKFNIFLDERWQGGVMFTDDSTYKKGYTYRYNIYSDQIEQRTLVDHSSINVVSIGTKKFIYSEYLNIENSLEEGYFEQIVGGECRLLLRREIKFKRATGDIRGYGANASTSVSEVLYIKPKGKPAVKILKTKDFFKQIMSDKEQAVNYIDKQLFIFITENKIKNIVNYYNQII